MTISQTMIRTAAISIVDTLESSGLLANTHHYQAVAQAVTALSGIPELVTILNNSESFVCSYCGYIGPKTTTAIAEHILNCDKHPVHSLAETIKELEANYQRIKAASEGQGALSELDGVEEWVVLVNGLRKQIATEIEYGQGLIKQNGELKSLLAASRAAVSDARSATANFSSENLILKTELNKLKSILDNRVGRLLLNGTKFFVVKASEPYARDVALLIKREEQGNHTWKRDDQINFDATLGPDWETHNALVALETELAQAKRQHTDFVDAVEQFAIRIEAKLDAILPQKPQQLLGFPVVETTFPESDSIQDLKFGPPLVSPADAPEQV